MTAAEVTIKLRTPHKAQRLVMSESKRYNVVACGRRWGKTEMGVEDLAIEPALEGKRIGWFAPTYKLLVDAWDHALSVLKPLGKLVRVSKAERRMMFPGGGLIEFWSTEPQQAGDDDSEVARGRHYHRIVYDEAARARRLKSDWTKAIRATLADHRGDAWFLSTPKGQSYFHQMWTWGQDGKPGWASWQMPTSTNPYIHPEEIEAARGDLPADAFEQEFLALFLANAANPFGIDAIRACILDIQPGPPVAWGVDLAKSVDWTVAIALNAQGQCCGYQRWQKKGWMHTMALLKAMIAHTPAQMDATGVGDPIVEQVQAVCPRVEGFKFTSSSKQTIMEGLAVGIQQERVTFPDGPIVHELETFEYEYKPSGVRYQAPEGMHDDCVDALALAYNCFTNAAPPLTMTLIGADDDEDDDDERMWSPC